MEELEILVPPVFLTAFFQIIKPLLGKFIKDHDWYPLVSAVIGIGANFIFKFYGATRPEIVAGGIIAGLAASGFYDFAKKTVLRHE